MRGLKRLRSARVISAGHAFVQNLAAAATSSALISTDDIGSQRSHRTDPRPLVDSTAENLVCFPPTQQTPWVHEDFLVFVEPGSEASHSKRTVPIRPHRRRLARRRDGHGRGGAGRAARGAM
jgi:hypothetical protein